MEKLFLPSSPSSTFLVTCEPVIKREKSWTDGLLPSSLVFIASLHLDKHHRRDQKPSARMRVQSGFTMAVLALLLAQPIMALNGAILAEETAVPITTGNGETDFEPRRLHGRSPLAGTPGGRGSPRPEASKRR